MKAELKALLEEAWKKRVDGLYEEAERLVKKAHAGCIEDDAEALGRVFHVYMQINYDQDKLQEAIRFSKQSIAWYKQAGIFNKVAHSTRHLADLSRHCGQHEEAEQLYRDALGLYRGDIETNAGDLANALRGFAITLESRQKMKEAITVWVETKDLYHSIHLEEGVVEAEGKINELQERMN